MHPHLLRAKLAVALPTDGIIFIQPPLRPGGAFQMPFHQRHLQASGQLPGQFGLADAGLALHQQGPLQQNGGIDRDFQIFGDDTGSGGSEFQLGIKALWGECPATPSRKFVATTSDKPWPFG